MSETTGIAWCNSTFNPWWGCTEVSPGCDRCYARELDARFHKAAHWGTGVPRKLMSDHYWNDPLRWNRKAQRTGEPWRVFCASMADILDTEAPAGQRERLIEMVDATPHLTWLFLTKRIELAGRLMIELIRRPRPNIWWGTTVENQEMANKRVKTLRLIPAALHWLSIEPMVGPIDLHAAGAFQPYMATPRIKWSVVGGESSDELVDNGMVYPRPMQLDWARLIKKQSEQNGAAFFMKQLGGLPKNKGDQMEDFPADLRARNFPIKGD
jgi:protein gp37